jgi:hypothetical protein
MPRLLGRGTTKHENRDGPMRGLEFYFCFKDLGYGEPREEYQLLEEVSKLLGAYLSSILTSDS